MPAATTPRVSIPALRGVCRSLSLIALFVPLATLLVCTPLMKTLGVAMAWISMIAGLRGVRAALARAASKEHEDGGRIRALAGWMLPLTWICVVCAMSEQLPRWTGVPGPAKVVGDLGFLMTAAGIAALISSMARLFRRMELPELAARWRRPAWAWWVVYVGPLTALQAWAAVHLMMRAPASLRLEGAAWGVVMLGLAIVMLTPSLMLFGTAWRTAKLLPKSNDRCPQCGYPRAGLVRNKCPECGAFLEPLAEEVASYGDTEESRGDEKADESKIIGADEPRTRGTGPDAEVAEAPVRLARLAVVPAALVLMIGLGGLLSIQTGGVRWRPAWMLMRDAAETLPKEQLTGGRALLAGFLGTSHEHQTRWFTWEAQEAQRELLGRLQTGTISAARARMLVREALAVQADRTVAMGSWAQLFSECYRLGVVNPDELDRFLVGSMHWEVKARTVVMEGDPIPFEVAWEWRGPAVGNALPSEDLVWQSLQLDLDEMRLDGAEVGVGPAAGTFIPRSGGVGYGHYEFIKHGAIPNWDLPRATVGPGDHEFSVEVVVAVGGIRASILPVLPEDPVGYRKPQRIVLNAPVRVVEQMARVTEGVADTSLRTGIAAGLTARLGPSIGDIDLLFRNAPAWKEVFAFEVIGEVDGQEYSMGAIEVGPAGPKMWHLPVPLELARLRRFQPETASRLRVLLRPSHEAAKQTLGAMKVLEGGDIELKIEETR